MYKLLKYIATVIMVWLSTSLYSHPMPSTLVSLNVSDKVTLKTQIPRSEFDVALDTKGFISKETLKTLLEPYISQHLTFRDVHGQLIPYILTDLYIEKDSTEFNGVYEELVFIIDLLPNNGLTIRKFFMHYDIVIHEVVTHEAIVDVTSDFDRGHLHGNKQIAVIRYDHDMKLVPPITIDLGAGSTFSGFKSILSMGMHHIKDGVDHLMFLLFLLIVAPMKVVDGQWVAHLNVWDNLKSIIGIITAFTIGHSLTLMAGTFGFSILSEQMVEILIACSILVTVLHSIKPLFEGREMWIAIGFGTIHGLAFSNILLAMQLDRSRLMWSLFGFNLGIELMQIFIAICIIPFLMIFSRYKSYSYFRYVVGMASLLISLSWLTERIMGQGNIVTHWVEATPKLSIYFWVILIYSTVSVYLYHRYQSKGDMGITKQKA